MVAWRWLIISHNAKNPFDRVDLPRQLSVKYERKAGRPLDQARKSPALSESESAKDVLSQMVEALKAQPPSLPAGYVGIHETAMDSFLTKTLELFQFLSKGFATYDAQGFVSNNDKKWNLAATDNLNMWLGMAATFSEGKATPNPPDWEALAREVESAVKQTESSTLEQDLEENGGETAEPPESFDEGGHQWFRDDIDLLEIKEGQVFLTMEKFGVQYHAIHGNAPEGSKSLSEKRKGKQPLRPTPDSKEVKEKDKKGESPKTHPVKEENPLGAKGEPKSKAL